MEHVPRTYGQSGLGLVYRAGHGAPWLDRPRQAGRAGLDPGVERDQAPQPKPARPRGRSAMAGRSIRSPGGCCRSRWARRPSSPDGCSTRPRSTIHHRLREETDTLDPEGKVVATTNTDPSLSGVQASCRALQARSSRCRQPIPLSRWRAGGPMISLAPAKAVELKPRTR